MFDMLLNWTSASAALNALSLLRCSWSVCFHWLAWEISDSKHWWKTFADADHQWGEKKKMWFVSICYDFRSCFLRSMRWPGVHRSFAHDRSFYANSLGLRRHRFFLSLSSVLSMWGEMSKRKEWRLISLWERAGDLFRDSSENWFRRRRKKKKRSQWCSYFSLAVLTSSEIFFHNELFRSRENVRSNANWDEEQVLIRIIIFLFPVFHFLSAPNFVKKADSERESGKREEKKLCIISFDVDMMSSDSFTRHRLINQSDFAICSCEVECKNAIMMALTTTTTTTGTTWESGRERI